MHAMCGGEAFNSGGNVRGGPFRATFTDFLVVKCLQCVEGAHLGLPLQRFSIGNVSAMCGGG